MGKEAINFKGDCPGAMRLQGNPRWDKHYAYDPLHIFSRNFDQSLRIPALLVHRNQPNFVVMSKGDAFCIRQLAINL